MVIETPEGMRSIDDDLVVVLYYLRSVEYETYADAILYLATGEALVGRMLTSELDALQKQIAGDYAPPPRLA